LGVDWADKSHQLYAADENGKKIKEIEVQQTAEGLAEFGRWLDERRSAGTELWAAIEKPQGRIVDFRCGGVPGQPQGAGSGAGSVSHEPVQE